MQASGAIDRPYIVENEDRGNSVGGRFTTYAWTVVGVNLAVILWGAYVRATGSGAGCGSHWPLCNGDVVPRAPKVQTIIEFTHRLSSGTELLMVVGLVFWAFRAYPSRHMVRRAAVVSGLFIVSEALIGAGLVLLNLVAHDDSVFRVIYLSVHLVNTFLLTGALTVTAWTSGGHSLRLRQRTPLTWAISAALVGTLILSVSGAITALGDTLFPASSFAQGYSQDFSPAAHFLIRLRILHPAIAVIVGAYALTMAFLARRRGLAGRLDEARAVNRAAWSLAIVVLAQFCVGLLNVALLAPIWLQLVHLLLANLMWIALLVLGATTLARNQQISHVVIH